MIKVSRMVGHVLLPQIFGWLSVCKFTESVGFGKKSRQKMHKLKENEQPEVFLSGNEKARSPL